MKIQKAQMTDLPALTRLACGLWPEHAPGEMHSALAQIIAKPDAAFFLACAEEAAIGFAQCQLRHDYVEGTDSSPVGYLEGIYVAPEHRGRGTAAALLAACEQWASELDCREFASDCELNNTQSLGFHLHAGFQEANRIICFTKKLVRP